MFACNQAMYLQIKIYNLSAILAKIETFRKFVKQA